MSDRTKLAAAATGSGATLLLVLTLFAMISGISNRVVAYIGESDAQVWVMREGSSNVHMNTSVVPAATEAAVSKVEGVKSSTAVLYAPQFAHLSKGGAHSKFFSYVVGFSGRKGGPWSLASGRIPRKGYEVVIDEVMAKKAGVTEGDSLKIWDRSFKIVGLSRESYSMANTLVFVPRKTMAKAANRQGIANYILVDVESGWKPSAVAKSIRRQVRGVNAMTTASLVSNDISMIYSMSLDLLYVMAFVSYLIALLVISLIAYTCTMSRIKEFGVLKALGAGRRRLYGVVLQQTAVPLAAGAVGGIVITLLVSRVVEAMMPDIHFIFTAEMVAWATLSLLLVGMFASAIPIKRVTGLDPMIVFRR